MPIPPFGSPPASDKNIKITDITDNDFSTSAHGFVPKGTDVGNFLKDDGTWAAAGGGKILQVVQASGGGELMTSSTFNSCGLYATITPADTNNAIFVMASSPRSYNNGTEYTYFSIYNGTSGEGSGSEIQQGLSYGPGWSGGTRMTQVMNVWHLPASTSAQTYTVMHKNANNSTLVGWFENGYGTSNANITLMEIQV